MPGFLQKWRILARRLRIFIIVWQRTGDETQNYPRPDENNGGNLQNQIYVHRKNSLTNKNIVIKNPKIVASSERIVSLLFLAGLFSRFLFLFLLIVYYNKFFVCQV
jgi:hypothetical protein